MASQATIRLRSTPPAPLEYNRRRPMQLLMLCVLGFLYTPLIALIVFSFNNSRRNIVWRGFTLDYYSQALADDALMGAFGNSLTIALLATVFSVALGTLAAIAMWRFRFTFKPLVEGVFALPMVVPEICMGIALLAFYSKIQWPSDIPWPLSLSSIAVAHITFCFPFVTTVVRARLTSFN